MIAPALLSGLASVQELLRETLRQVPAEAAMCQLSPERPSLAWLFANAVYREAYWLRERLDQDQDLTARARVFFIRDTAAGGLTLDRQCAGLPPPPHLLAWAVEIQDEHLRRLATPGALPPHPLLEHDRLPWWLLQEHAKDYERMLAQRLALVLAPVSAQEQGDASADYRVATPLRAASLADVMAAPAAMVEQGHYRVGARGDAFAYDNELPPQAVPLSAYRITRAPVSNAQYLAFMQAGGYQDAALWPEAGESTAARMPHPLQWRQDAAGRWFDVSLNGPADLPADAPVSGLDQAEAWAFARWAARLGGACAGAVLPHEYQWEVAARAGQLEVAGSVWEWCAGPLHAYPEFMPFPGPESPSVAAFAAGAVTLKGAGLHTLPALRRASFRHWAMPDDRFAGAGLRLVLPPD
ncbi:SUMF1/EgtB/PvdO family nonheme iron enzyme [Thiohalocapsa marina]|uniref:SUMF1/EgtB/PvdO family nonheme iron enzyme n=1 Tax=Thiohalocapsa marina TaxID=424902 RepID=A0A5M8FPA0_9GAMM|nr:SUMF1/EgtB/PvdO family nonheme iron enzyme [Thiohalocapsa marina]KAA6186599.1 SUMF1/EgtB/PvdO family nonheme iron enzyme [Thiohalocapsa marina]